MPQQANARRLMQAVSLYDSGLSFSQVGREMGGISKQGAAALVRRGRELIDNKSTDISSHKHLPNRAMARLEYAVKAMGVDFLDGNIPASFVVENIKRDWFLSLPMVGPVAASQIDEWLAANGEVWE